jgi:hypothetical protein
MIAVGIVIAVACGIAILIVLWMFVWAAREDGRDQERRDARLRRR